MSKVAREIRLSVLAVRMDAMCGRYASTMGQMTLYGLFAAEQEPEDESVGIVPALTALPPKPGDEESASAPAQTPADSSAVRDSGERPIEDLALGRFNIAPTTNVSVVFDRVLKRAQHDSAEGDGADDGGAQADGAGPSEQVRRIAGMRWGLVPSWAKDPSVGNRMINARAESISEKPAFRKPLGKRRCLIPASGYFEWRKAPAVGGGAGRGSSGNGPAAKKQPFYITPADGSTMAFAGLWEFWKAPDGRWLRSMTIITTEAVGELATIHDRMPLVLPASEWDDWLDTSNGAPDVMPLLSPPSESLVAELELRPVSARVGNVANDDAGLLERVEIAP